ncbi:hypothetical protein C8R46DRAFT_1084134 [Mycena filopes]|nr:hypothetical protein C8R46DRAFT_1084134 [Mycena filopes]
MRLKIQSVPPLPVLRVWFSPGESICVTIADLIASLTNEFASKLKDASLQLSLDGFELLGASLLSDVLRDGDLVVVKAAEISKKTAVGKKRKRSPSPKNIPPAVSTRSPSVSSSSSSSSSSSTDESDTDSDSSTSSSSSSPPPTFTTHPRVQTQTARRAAPTYPPIAPKNPMHVPPGKGLSSTHSRNQRRRMKRLATTNALSIPAPVPDFVSATNATSVVKQTDAEDRREKARQSKGPAPDVASALNKAFGGNERAGRLDPGAFDAAEPPSPSTLHTPLYPPTEAEEMLNVQMMSMLPKSKNKNKSRRGADEVDPRSRKIVFGSPPPPVAELSFSNEGEVRRSRPMLIPPSALPPRLIPSNVFITCIDVEEGMKKPRKKKRRVEQETEESWAVDEPMMLNYGDGDVSGLVVEQRALDPSMFDLEAAPVITSHTQLTEGCIIGYMGLMMNLKNFTPEIGQRYGRVMSWTPDEAVNIQPLFTNEDSDEEELEWREVEGQWKLCT